MTIICKAPMVCIKNVSAAGLDLLNNFIGFEVLLSHLCPTILTVDINFDIMKT